jgi:uncharacterized protein YdeI (BOF family)
MQETIIALAAPARSAFAEGTRKIPVRIGHRPNGQIIEKKSTVELTGEYDKERFEPSKLKVNPIEVVL